MVTLHFVLLIGAVWIISMLLLCLWIPSLRWQYGLTGNAANLKAGDLPWILLGPILILFLCITIVDQH